ncbi:MAG: TRAP transporter large permease [Pyramidobacter sp.]|uniref:TRAP transporter large permease n=1 Tax=Pyramidobacter sp. TaxID=1943581 RepID=UPI002A7F4A98|nr:TRAP transporter large permease [Pyramidobacter sp.]MDY4031438.1 TRAP transporter large permease [Pyramidobacter sp.]MDY4172365.1 TRAP transporter large permease [Evtepia sp.]
MKELFHDPAFWTVVLFVIPLLLRVPIAVSLGFASIAVAYFWDLGVDMTSYNFFASIVKYPLLAVPFFILAGNIMDKASIADKIIDFIKELVGSLTGGLAIAAIGVAVFWGAVSGSTSATVAAIGAILIPGMVQAGYDKPFATAVISVASGLAIIIPPSITFILYAVITGVSVGAIFAAGFLPGFVIAAFLMISAWFTSRKKGYRGAPRSNGVKGILIAGRKAFWALMTPVVILGGIYGGVFTPTEAASVACFYGLFVGAVIYRKIGWKELYEILIESLNSSAAVMLVCTCAGLYSWIGSTVGMIEKASGLLLGISPNQYIILFMIYFILFIGGMLLDGVSMLYVFMPILMPLMKQFNWDPVWFGVMVTTMVAIGTITPPVAMNLYVGCRISNLTIEELTPPVIPLLLATIVALIVLTFVPSITLFLPKLLGLM